MWVKEMRVKFLSRNWISRVKVRVIDVIVIKTKGGSLVGA
jgi:hypothetical protein